MRSTKLLIPDQVVEEVRVTQLPNYEERSDVSFVDFVTMSRFNEEVTFVPSMTPVTFQDTVICYKDSTRKRFKSQTFYEPKLKPKYFSDTLFVFPKKPQKSFVTYVDYHIDECRRWFRTSMEFKARTYTTSAIIPPKNEPQNDVTNNDEIENKTEIKTSDGPGASQIYLPRWNKDGLDRPGNQTPLVNGDIYINGFL